MSLGMVAMLVPWVDPLPRLYWQVVFGLAAGHVAVRLIRRHVRSVPVPSPHLGGHHELHLVVGGLAMVYMLGVMPAEHAMADGMEMAATGSAGVAVPVLTWAFIAYSWCSWCGWVPGWRSPRTPRRPRPWRPLR